MKQTVSFGGVSVGSSAAITPHGEGRSNRRAFARPDVAIPFKGEPVDGKAGQEDPKTQIIEISPATRGGLSFRGAVIESPSGGEKHGRTGFSSTCATSRRDLGGQGTVDGVAAVSKRVTKGITVAFKRSF